MEGCIDKNIPRAGTNNVGESRTPSEEGVWPMYTGGATAAMKESRRSEEKNDFGNVSLDDERQSDLAAMTTASEGDGGSRAVTPASIGAGPSRFYGRPESGSDESGNETAASRSQDRGSEREREKIRATYRRKRRGSDLENSPEKDKGVALKPSSKRGRGRPPTTGQYVGLAKSKREYLELKEKEIAMEAEKEVLEMTKKLPELRSHRLSEASLIDCAMTEDEVVTAAKLGSAITQSLDAILAVTQKSKNLKGTSIAALKKATCTIREASSALLSRSASEETRALVEANTRLSRELDEMKKELEAVKRKLADAQPHTAPKTIQEPNMEEILQRAMREAVSLMNARMDARLEGLEARLLPEPRLRPPLAADKKRDSAVSTLSGTRPQQAGKESETPPPPEPSVSTLMPPTNPGPKPKRTKKGRKSAAAAEAAAARRDTVTTAAGSQPAATPSWTEVVKRGKGKAPRTVEVKKKVQKKKEKKKKDKQLRAPKTAAVVLTLRPDAEKNGVTYQSVIDKAKQHLDLTALDIAAVKFKRAVTGARMYEVSGTACKEKADALAGKLKEIVGEDMVHVSRPQKCAELRIAGLDDSASAAEIATAVARTGGCRAEDVRVGEIRVDRRGRGSAWVKCPVEAAKQVTAPNAKVYVGWTVVQVTLLSARKMRCFKCQEEGHTRATCSSEIDRSELCFRCGQPGHSTKHCGNPPHCALCEAREKPADHIVGSRRCDKSAPPSKKKRKGPEKSQAPEKGNLNHCAQAQDLWVQALLQWEIDVAVIAEPYRVLERGDWLGDVNSSVALVFGPKIVPPSSRNSIRGRGFVVAILGTLTVVGVYFSPNRPIVELEALLLRLTAVVEGSTQPVVVAGDFNAKSPLWGSPATNARGRLMEEWLAATGLVLANRGATSTCVRRQGESIVDLTLVSPAIAQHVTEWRVLSRTETLSDHLYIRFVISHLTEQGRTISPGAGPRWSLKKLDRDILKEAAAVASWAPLPSEDVEECVEWLTEAAHNICDASMPRAGPVPPRRQTYWWSPDLKRLREECVAARRRYLRYRRRRIRNAEEEDAIYDGYRSARHHLRDAIRTAKREAWEDFLRTLEQDPWGRPYKWVRQKLRPAAPPLTQSLQPDLCRSIVSALFPPRAEWSPPSMAPPTAEPEEEEEIPPVSAGELAAAVHKMSLQNKAPGLDGVPGRVWVLAMEHMEARVLAVLNLCLVQGRVPRRWKTGKLVLLRKAGRPEDQPSAYRPIVLIDEICKTFERIIVARLNRHLESVGPNLSDAQFGFRSRRSTIDAVARIRSITEQEISQGGVVLVVSLDITNAFNTLPWETIKEALRYHRVPRYLRRTIGDYLSERSVQYPTEDGWEEQEVDCGVPQGSALGPELWDLGFDHVLRGANLPGVELVAYADDTAVVCRAKTHREATILATAAVAQVVRRIQALGLTVALNKTEAIIFHGPRNAPPPGLAIIVGGTSIQIASTMTYLGLVLDSRWTFKEHFRRLSEKVTKAAGALASLLPNLGGPSLTCRRLYMGVIRSMVMYGAPIWAEDLAAVNRQALGRLQRIMATRAVRGYRTISRDAACLLAGSVPWDLDAKTLADVYWRSAEVRAGGSNPLPEAVRRWREEANDRALEEWEERLAEPRVSVDLILAIRPVFREWLGRKNGALSFRLTQVLTGHGCFGRYLCEIAGREETTRCHHCGEDRDTAAHTLTACPSWILQRAALTAAIGQDISLPTMVRAMLRSELEWKAVENFAEEVIAAKEEAEREREREALDPRRRRRTRRQHVIQIDDLPP
ncbi:uncharacterized protein LOC121731828 [Aricia agestis]|uniref:uncharacterized protein LOC121731828 n=1 Tax=Aricia agestis TaxID=91739 RepID=UPI001C207E66|nr:uncharacterized protein LOC121731828 [Aricia agestis]